MPELKTVAPTNEKPNSLVDAPLKPTAEIHVLVGGPYKFDGEEHRYGHTAVRIRTTKSDLTYDFGRYGETSGTFGEEGEGILRVWGDFNAYIKGENALKRVTADVMYLVFDHQADAATGFFDAHMKAGTLKQNGVRGTGSFKVYKLAQPYTALGNNCTTISMEATKRAIPKIDNGSQPFVKPDAVMNMGERVAMKSVGGGTPSRLFLPANLQTFLLSNTGVKSNSVTYHGSTK